MTAMEHAHRMKVDPDYASEVAMILDQYAGRDS
jgi:hypothetical protein